MAYKQKSPLIVAEGGTGDTSLTAYAVVCGGTTTTGALQSIASVGTAGQVLTSNGPALLPTFQAAASGGITTIAGNTGTATGATVTVASSNSTVKFAAAAAADTLDFSGDANSNIVMGTALPALTIGNHNVGVGTSVLNALTSGTDNVTVGYHAGAALTNSSSNTAVGSGALSAASGASVFNITAIGFGSFGSLTTGGGDNNTGCGFNSFSSMTSGGGVSNTGCGSETCLVLTTGSGNCTLGRSSLSGLSTGNYNVAIGPANIIGTKAAGINYSSSESSNILISNDGTALESHTIRIGTSGSGDIQQNRCFIAGIDGVNVGSVAKVLTMASDQIGTATITAGTGITVTAGANTITIANSSTGMTWTIVTGTSQGLVANNGYIANNAGQVTFTLPATAAVGDTFRVTGKNNATGWKIAQNAGQTIFFGTASTTPGVGGSLTSSATRDAIEFICVTTNNDFQVLSSIGNITVV